jgi:hypothetical protein
LLLLLLSRFLLLLVPGRIIGILSERCIRGSQIHRPHKKSRIHRALLLPLGLLLLLLLSNQIQFGEDQQLIGRFDWKIQRKLKHQSSAGRSSGKQE